MRDVYMIAGGMSRFTKTRPDKTFQAMVKEAYDAAKQPEFCGKETRAGSVYAFGSAATSESGSYTVVSM